MPPVFWSDSYRTGHDGLDEHHCELLSHLAEIRAAVDFGRTTSHVLGMLDDWLDLFARHARIEEQLMERLRLPGGIAHREVHMAEHAEFLHQAMAVRNLYARQGDGDQALETLAANLVSFDMIRRDFEMIGLLLREGITLDR